MLRLSSGGTVVVASLFTLLLALAVRAQELNLAQIRAEVPISPLITAIWNEQTDRVKALLDAGADPNAPSEKQQTTPWQWAVIAGHRESLELMRDKADVHPKSLATPRLMWMALQRNDVRLVTQFLTAGADVEFRADGYTPLMSAAASGSVEIMRLVLERGARVDVQDQFGDTALMAAVRGGRADGVRLLLNHGADVALKDAEGRTALTWALHDSRDDLVRLLTEAGSRPETAAAGARELGEGNTAHAAVLRALPPLQRSAAVWNERRECASCHHQGIVVPVIALAGRHGYPVDRTQASAQAQRLDEEFVPLEPDFRTSAATAVGVTRFSMRLAGTAAFSLAWMLAARAEADPTRSSAHEAAARLLGRMQMPDGRWRVTAPRVPLEYSDIKATATAIRALKAYARDDDETRSRLDRARIWLLNARPSTTDDLCFRLLGLGWSGVRGRPLDAARDALAREQREDGGWPQQPWMNTDAYATALALLALHDSGATAATDDMYQRGVRYLLRTQHRDGSWFVPKRAPSFNRYFDSGFPHGKHQFISFAATGLATMALLRTTPAAQATGAPRAPR